MVVLWFHPSLLFNTSNYIILLLALVSIIGDHIVSHTKLHLFQALFDNATHAIIGGLSWLFVCINFKSRSHIQILTEIALCAGIASVIDVDHFVSARSFHLKDATNLPKRPPLHCSTFPVLFCGLVLILGYLLQVELWKKSALIVLTAFLSHHTRDATRRGYWVYPFGSTQPIPYYCYVGVTCCIPFFVCWLHRIVRVESAKYVPMGKESVI